MPRPGLSEKNILKEGTGDECPEYDKQEGVEVVLNRWHPGLNWDGVEWVSVVRWGEDRYLVEERGRGRICKIVTEEGAQEVGRYYLRERGWPPRWVVTSEPEKLSGQDWIPDEYEYISSIVCDLCGEDTPPLEVLTPDIDDPNPDCYCRDCWEDMD